MNPFDCELTELFPTETFTNMGRYEHIPNDALSDIFKQVQPLSSLDGDITILAPEIVETVSINESEIQNHEIFDLIGDSCFKEPPTFGSLLSLDNDDLLRSEPSAFNFDKITKCSEIESSVNCLNSIVPEALQNENDIKIARVEQEDDKDLRNRDSCIHKIVDILATFVDESSEDGVLNFNSDLLNHHLESSSSLFSEAKPCNETFNLNSLSISKFQVPDASTGTGLKENSLFDKLSHVLSEDILGETISLSNLETVKEDFATHNVLDESHSKTDPSACQLSKNSHLLFPQERKYSERLLLPCLTKFCCNMCEPKMFFLSKDDFLQHQKNHKARVLKKTPFMCKECSSTYSTYVMYQNHRRTHHKHKCEICLKEVLPSSLKNHLAVHNKSLGLICEYCGLNFASKIKLDEHLSLHSGTKLYTCEQCKRSFSNHGSYWIHKKWHESLRPYKCGCGLSFRHSSTLAIHRRQTVCSRNSILINTKKHFSQANECLSNANPSCPKEKSSSSNSPNCRAKMNNSLPSKNFSSPANQSVEAYDPSLQSSAPSDQNSSKSNMVSKNFKIIVSRFPKRKHRCELCNQRFPTPSSLRVHQLKHTEERPFKCQRCQKDFRIKNSLLRHQKSSAACDRTLKKRLMHEREASLTVSSKKIRPKVTPVEHCPHCNIIFPDFQSLVDHIQNLCNEA